MRLLTTETTVLEVPERLITTGATVLERLEFVNNMRISAGGAREVGNRRGNSA